MENRESEDNKIPRKVWKAVETKARKVRMEKIKERRKEARREGTEKGEKTKEEKGGECKKNSGRMGNIG